MKDIIFYKYEIKEKYIVKEKYKDKKKKGQYKEVVKYRPCNFKDLMRRIESKKNFRSQASYSNFAREYNFTTKKIIIDNDFIQLIIYQFAGGVDSERTVYHDTKKNVDNENKRGDNEVEKKLQSLILVHHKKEDKTVIFSERREGLLNYQNFFNFYEDQGYSFYTYHSSDLNKFLKGYKCIEIIEESNDKDGRNICNDRYLLNVIRSKNSLGFELPDNIREIFGNSSKKKHNKVTLVSDSGSKMTISEGKYHDRIVLNARYDILQGGFEIDSLCEVVEEKISEISKL